ncbi:2-C-methyl-D-erythritol 4-phosphate cytidylyltransferase [Desulfosarcina sp. OttesenSCG-928-A07]|nr:2-C-methyl-D-erythritol 4-phosphate cytidylyltransferase [Desulfosarcina sp. OttesenSCG-928-G17]MDL2328416.1 2-C-methyl-D-erythritol 4-phosphate cytidylyltransferase [Desulfosarcina sp. OttesenSCG-928-A07]
MVSAVIVAGGSGLRMGAPVKKQYLSLSGTPIVVHTLKALDRFSALNRMVLVVPEADLDWCQDHLIVPFSFDHPVHLTSGGRERQDSVMRGLAALAGGGNDIVMIHDGVRPFVRTSLMEKLVDHAKRTGACIPVVPATDTLKQGDETGMIIRTLDRRNIYLAQTPQVFRLDMIRKAYQNLPKSGVTVTDDASVAEVAGNPVQMIPGDPFNIKITTPADLIIARVIHQEKDDRSILS